MLDLNELEWKDETVDGYKGATARPYFGFNYAVTDSYYIITSTELKTNFMVRKEASGLLVCKMFCQLHHNAHKTSIEKALAKEAALTIKPTERFIDLKEELGKIPPPHVAPV